MTTHRSIPILLGLVLLVLTINILANTEFPTTAPPIPFTDVAIPPIISSRFGYIPSPTISIRLAMDTAVLTNLENPQAKVDLVWYPAPIQSIDGKSDLIPPVNSTKVILRPMGNAPTLGPFPLKSWIHSTTTGNNPIQSPTPDPIDDADLTMWTTSLSSRPITKSDFYSIQIRLELLVGNLGTSFIPNSKVGDIEISVSLSGTGTPTEEVTQFYGKFDISAKLKPSGLDTAFAFKPYPLEIGDPTMAFTFISPWEPLLSDTFLPLLPQFEPYWTKGPPRITNRHIMQWAMNIPWNMWLGGYNRKDESVFGAMRPERVRLSTLGSLWFLNNSTTILANNDQNNNYHSTAVPITCLVNGIEVGATINREKIEFNFPTVGTEQNWQRLQQQHQQPTSSSSSSSQQESGFSEQIIIELNLDSTFWTSLLGPVHPPSPSPPTPTPTSTFLQQTIINPPVSPFGFSNFTISCPSAPIFTTNTNTPSSTQDHDFDRGILVEIVGRNDADYDPASLELNSTTAIVVPFVITPEASGTGAHCAGAAPMSFHGIPRHWISYSRWDNPQPSSSHTTTTSSTLTSATTARAPTFTPSLPPQPFPIITSPTGVVLAQAPHPLTASTTITALVSTIIGLDRFNMGELSKPNLYFHIRFTNPGSDFSTFTPAHDFLVPVNIFVQPIEDNDEGKVWVLQSFWHKLNVFETQLIHIPDGLWSPQTQRHWKISFNVDLVGRNPWETSSKLRFFDEVSIIVEDVNYSLQCGHPGPFSVLQHIPITGWFHGASEALIPKDQSEPILPDYVNGAGFFHIQHDPLQWDFYTISTTTQLNTVLIFDDGSKLNNQQDEGGMPDVVESVTIHTNGWYQFHQNNVAGQNDQIATGDGNNNSNNSNNNNDTTDPIILHCTNYLDQIIKDCLPTSVIITPESVSFKITLNPQPPSAASLTKAQIPTKITITAGPTLTIITRPYVVVNDAGYPSAPLPIVNLIATVQILPQPQQQQEQPSQTISLALSFKLGDDPAKVFSAKAHQDRYIPPSPPTPTEKKHSILFWILIAGGILLILIVISGGIIKWKVDSVKYKSQQDQLFLEELVARDNEERDQRERQMDATLQSMNKALEANSPPTYLDVSDEPLPDYDHGLDDDDMGTSHGSNVKGEVDHPPEMETPIPYNDDWSVNMDSSSTASTASPHTTTTTTTSTTSPTAHPHKD